MTEMQFRGTYAFQSQASAGELETQILSARAAGLVAPILELPITRDDDKPSCLTVEVVDEAPVVNDVGTVYRCHLHPYRGNVIREVPILIPNPAGDKRAHVTVSY